MSPVPVIEANASASSAGGEAAGAGAGFCEPPQAAAITRTGRARDIRGHHRDPAARASPISAARERREQVELVAVLEHPVAVLGDRGALAVPHQGLGEVRALDERIAER